MNAPRVIGSESYWGQPLAWNRAAVRDGVRRRVFALSLGDVFEDRPDLVAPRNQLWDVIRNTPSLDWLLLTKRPQNWWMMWPTRRSGWRDGPNHVDELEVGDIEWDNLPNVWMGVSVENQKYADIRVPVLLKIPAAVRWVSYEPALGPVSWSRWMSGLDVSRDENGDDLGSASDGSNLDWIIIGGESGPQARPFDLTWARSTITQCSGSGVSCFIKQLGTRWKHDFEFPDRPVIGRWKDPKGGDPDEWPDDLRVREFPGSSADSLRSSMSARPC